MSKIRSSVIHVEQFIKQDKQVFENVVCAFGSRLEQTARGILGNQEDAEDCVQECFLSAYKNANKFRRNAEIYTWLHRILINACYKKLRDTKRSSMVSWDQFDLPLGYENSCTDLPEEAVINLEPMAEKEVMRFQLSRAMDTLPQGQQTVLRLRFEEGLSLRDIADQLSINVSTAKVRLYRAKTMLTETLSLQNAPKNT